MNRNGRGPRAISNTSGLRSTGSRLDGGVESPKKD